MEYLLQQERLCWAQSRKKIPRKNGEPQYVAIPIDNTWTKVIEREEFKHKLIKRDKNGESIFHWAIYINGEWRKSDPHFFWLAPIPEL